MSKHKISVGGAVKPSSWTMKIVSGIKSQLHREDNVISVGEDVKAPFTLTTDIQPELRKVDAATDDFEIDPDGKVSLTKRTQIDNADWTLSTRPTDVVMTGELVNGESQIKITTQDGKNSINTTDTVKPSLFKALFPVRKLINTTFAVGNIMKHLKVKVIACNDEGENDSAPEVMLYKAPTPQWAYIVADNKVVMKWTDTIAVDRIYRLKYKIDNGEYQYVELEGDKAVTGKVYTYEIPLLPTQVAEVSLCVVDDTKEHIYSDIVLMSKANDVNLIPPSNFSHSWLGVDELQLKWDDSYTVDKDYELIYSIDGGEEQVAIIPTTSMDGIGEIQAHTITLRELQTVEARVRMRWAMNMSGWANQTVLHNLKAPTNLRFEIVKEGTKISWDGNVLAESYKVFTDGIELANVTTTEAIVTKEINGDVYVIAYNERFTSIPSETIFIKSKPNVPVKLDAKFEEMIDGYDFNVSFIDNSQIETSYRVDYTIDDGVTESVTVDSQEIIPPNATVDKEDPYKLWTTFESKDGSGIEVNRVTEGGEIKKAEILGSTVKNINTNTSKLLFTASSAGSSYSIGNMMKDGTYTFVFDTNFTHVSGNLDLLTNGFNWDTDIRKIPSGMSYYVKTITNSSDVQALRFWSNGSVGSASVMIFEGDVTNQITSYIPFGLTSTEAVIEANGTKYSFYEPTIKGETKVVDGKLVSLESTDASLPKLGSVPSVSDTLDLARGVLVENTKEIVLSNNNNWKTFGQTDLFIMFYYILSDAIVDLYTINNRFKTKDGINVVEADEFLGGYNKQIRVCLSKSKLTTPDVAGFKAWLQANPTTVRYQLATPIQTQLTPSQLATYSQHKKVILLSKVGDVTDKIELKEDESSVWNSNFKKRVLDGSENWITDSNATVLENTVCLSYTGLTDRAVGSTNLISNLFTTNSGLLTQDVEGIRGYGGSTPISIRILKSKLSTPDVTGFKAWLTQNPVTIKYQLATPITTPIPKSLTPTIPLESNNKISIGNGVNPSNYTLLAPIYREPVTVNFKTGAIEDHISVKVAAINESGENDLGEVVSIYVSPQPRWSYLFTDKQMLIDWQDKFDFETGYKIQYRIGNGEYQYDTIDSSQIELGGNVQYRFGLDETDEATVRICCVSNQDHFYSKPITVSKALDKTILPPNEFKYRWTGGGGIEFSWLDDYTVENGFDFIYSINNGVEVTEFIPTTDKEGIGKYYLVNKTLKERDRINAKVRMVWDINKSQMSSVDAVYIPSEAKPVDGLCRERTETGIKIKWNPQEAVEKYIVTYQRFGDIAKQIETIDDWYFMDVDYSDNREIVIYVQAQMVGGSISDVKERMVFCPFEEAYSVYTDIFTQQGESHYVNQIVYMEGGKDTYDVCQISTNPSTVEAIINQVSYNPFTMQKYDINSVVSNTGYKQSHQMYSFINSPKLELGKFGVSQLFTTQMANTYDMINNIFTVNRNRYTINSIISKPIIATMGDSITAGLHKASLVRRLTYKNKFNRWNTLIAL